MRLLRISIGQLKNHRIMLLGTFMQGESYLCSIRIMNKRHHSLLLLYRSMRMRRSRLSRGRNVNYYQVIRQMLILLYKAFKSNNTGEHTSSFTKKTMKAFSSVNAKMNQSSRHANLCVEDSRKQAQQVSSSSQSSTKIT